MATSKFKIYYTIHNNGDGGLSIRFHEDEESAQLGCDLEDLDCPHTDNYPVSKTLEFDENGKLLNPTFSKAELRRKLAEANGEEIDEEEPEEVAQPPRRPSGPAPQ